MSSTQPLIAIVSNNSELVPMLDSTLTAAGYQALWCGGHKRAFAVIEAQQPDVTLLDMQGSAFTPGLAVLNQMRLDPETAALTALALVDAAALDAASGRLANNGAPALATVCTLETLLATIAGLVPTRERAVGH